MNAQNRPILDPVIGVIVFVAGMAFGLFAWSIAATRFDIDGILVTNSPDEVFRNYALVVGAVFAGLVAIAALFINARRVQAAEVANAETELHNREQRAREAEQQFDASLAMSVQQLEGDSPAIRGVALATMKRQASASVAQACVIADTLSAMVRERGAKENLVTSRSTRTVPGQESKETTETLRFNRQLLDALIGMRRYVNGVQPIDLSRMNLTEVRLSSRNLAGFDFSYSKLIGARMMLAHLEDANLYGADLTGADLSSAKAMNISLSYTKIALTDFTHANLTGATITPRLMAAEEGRDHQAEFGGATLASAKFAGTFAGCNFFKADFTGAVLSRARFENCRFDRSTLANCDIRDSKFDKCSFDGAIFTNVLYNEHTEIKDLLSAAQLAGLREG